MLLTAVERHIESGRYVEFCSGANSSLVDHIDRCKVVYTPSGIEALVPASTVRARYSKIYRSYNRIRSILASDTNEYLPFYRLHDDLLVEIWDYLDVCDRNNVAAVSRRLRSLALNTARLWRFINLDGSLSVPRIETLLKRAEVVPLHIRATDHHLRELRPSFPLTRIFLPLPPLPLPQLPPPPLSYHNFPSPSGFYSRYLLSPGLFHPQYPPLQPILIPPKHLQLSAKIISRAIVLDIVSQQRQSTTNLKIELLAVPMPILRSLRLRSLQVSVSPPFQYNSRASTPVTKPFFSGRTPLLRHLSVIGSNLSWSAPVFCNLTYLLVRKPDTRVSVSLLVQILRGCPSLTYLGLEAAILSSVPNETCSSVKLPSLERLYITDMDTRRISAALNRISAPHALECDFTSADWSWFDSTHLATNSSPFNNLEATQHVILRDMEHCTSRWTIECRWEGNQAVRFHFDPAAAYNLPRVRDEANDTARFIDTLRRSPILLDQVQSLTLRGAFNIATITRILGLFPAIESLSTRGTYPSPGSMGESWSIIDILSVQYCPQLRAIDIGPSPAPYSLLMWLSSRSAPGGKCCRLNRVVVTSVQPLPSEMRSKITSMLDKFLWRMATTPRAPYYTGRTIPLLPSFYPLQPFNVSTPHQVEGASWDTDDEEEWTRVPSPDEDPSNVSLCEQDDPTLVYCNRAWRGRWDYFAIPEK